MGKHSSQTQILGSRLEQQNSLQTQSKTENGSAHQNGCAKRSNIKASINHCNGFDYRAQEEDLTGSSLSKNRVLATFDERFEETAFWSAFFTYITYLVWGLVGHLRDFFRRLRIEKNKAAVEPYNTRGFVPLFHSFESFFNRNFYRHVRDCFNRPVGGVPCSEFDLLERVTEDHNWTFNMTGRLMRAINMGSYNYLGFSAADGPCSDQAEQTIREQGVGVAASRAEFGFPESQAELEKTVSEFLGHEDALVFQMGFATNSLNLPAILNKNCCVISDELNHASLVLGMRLSGATVKIFRHNDMRALERRLREAITEGNPRTRRPFKKILIIVEGIASMEGSIVKLPEVIRLKKKYNAYLYMDEAHSIGALGPHGRGVVDYFGVNPRDVDILMGTFTKSFGSAGGYIAGSKKLISYLRAHSHSTIYGCGMSPPIAKQIIASMRIIMGLECPGEGERRIAQLAWNARYFRRRLHEKGYLVYGNKDSPVVPMLIYNPCKLGYFSREMLKHGVGVVVAGYPATPIISARVRFCISASHTKQMLDHVIDVVDKTDEMIHIRYSNQAPPQNCSENDPDFHASYLTKHFEANPTLSPVDPLPFEASLPHDSSSRQNLTPVQHGLAYSVLENGFGNGDRICPADESETEESSSETPVALTHSDSDPDADQDNPTELESTGLNRKET